MGIKLKDYVDYDIENWISEEEAEQLFRAAGYVELNHIVGYKNIEINASKLPEGFDELSEGGFQKDFNKSMRINVSVLSPQESTTAIKSVLEEAIGRSVRKDFDFSGLKGVV